MLPSLVNVLVLMGQAAGTQVDVRPETAAVTIRGIVEAQDAKCIPLAVDALANSRGIRQLQDMVECLVRQEVKVGVGQSVSSSHRRNY